MEKSDWATGNIRRSLLQVFLLGLLFIFPLYGALYPVREVLDSPVIVSLERCAERYEITKNWMEAAGFTNIERWNAVDGRSTEKAVFEDLNIFFGSPGERGCAASHLLLWKAFAEDSSDKEFLFIAEDDMLPHSKFAELFPIYWAETPEDFDFLLVGNWFDRKAVKRNPKNANRFVIRCPAFCTHAYIVSKKGAKKLYEGYLLSSRGFAAIDHYLRDLLTTGAMEGYCYNGTMFPEMCKLQRSLILRPLDTGICFQNRCVQRTILYRDTSLPCSIHSP